MCRWLLLGIPRISKIPLPPGRLFQNPAEISKSPLPTGRTYAKEFFVSSTGGVVDSFSSLGGDRPRPLSRATTSTYLGWRKLSLGLHDHRSSFASVFNQRPSIFPFVTKAVTGFRRRRWERTGRHNPSLPDLIPSVSGEASATSVCRLGSIGPEPFSGIPEEPCQLTSAR